MPASGSSSQAGNPMSSGFNVTAAPSPRSPSRPTTPAPHVKANAYSPEPPSWRPLLHSGCENLAVPDYYLPTASNPENDMNENNVRVGLPARQTVVNENFSAHSVILSILPPLLPALSTLFEEVLRRRESLIGASEVKPHTYRAPPRVTLNEIKLSAYANDLADPSVPLSKLAKNLPHGFRGEKMLEMLWLGANPNAAAALQAASNASRFSQGLPPLSVTAGSSEAGTRDSLYGGKAATNSVPIDRATWFIRVVGASDLANRTRGSAHVSVSTFTADFTATLVAWMRRQLAELTDVNFKSDGKSDVKQGSQGRTIDGFIAKWTAKWQYSRDLLESLFEEGLIDNRTWCGFITASFQTATVTQLPLVLACLQDCIPSIVKNDHLSKIVVVAACGHWQALSQSSDNRKAFQKLEDGLQEVVQVMWAENCDAFVSRTLWNAHGTVLRELLQPSAGLTGYAEAQHRSLCILDSHLKAGKHGQQSQHAVRTLIHQSDAMDEGTDLGSLENTVAALLVSNDYTILLRTLLDWSCSSVRYSRSDWRPIMASRIISNISRHLQQKRTATTGQESKLQKSLLEWLDAISASAVLESRTDFNLLLTLLSRLSKEGLFSYPRFLHRLSTRDLTTKSSLATRSSPLSASNDGQATTSRATDDLQVRLLRSLPVHDMSTSLRHQRRLAIYGARTKESREEALHRRALRDFATVFPFLFSDAEGQGHTQNILTEQVIRTSLPHLWQSNRFVSHRLLTRQLLPAVLSWMKGTPTVYPEQIVALCSVFAACREWHCIGDVLELLLQRFWSLRSSPSREDAKQTAFDMLTTYHDITVLNARPFAALGRLSSIRQQLAEAALAMQSNQPATQGGSHSLEEGLEIGRLLLIAKQDLDPMTPLTWQQDEQATLSYRRGCEALLSRQSASPERDCVHLWSLYLHSMTGLLQNASKEQPGEDEGLVDTWFAIGRLDANGLARVCRRCSIHLSTNWQTNCLETFQKLNGQDVSTQSRSRIAGFMTCLFLQQAIAKDEFFFVLLKMLESASVSGPVHSRSHTVAIALQILSYLTEDHSTVGAQTTLRQRLEAKAALSTARPEQIVEICACCAVLATNDEHNEQQQEIQTTLQQLAGLEHVQDHITLYPYVLSDSARKALRTGWSKAQEALELLYSCFSDPNRPSFTTRPALDVEAEEVADRVEDNLQVDATVEELAFLFDSLNAVEASQQMKAASKTNKCAQAVLPLLFVGPEANLSSGLRLWNLGGRAFRTSTGEALWRLLSDRMVAAKDVEWSGTQERDKVSSATDVIEALEAILGVCENSVLPMCPADALQALLGCITDTFVQAAQTTGPHDLRWISIHCALLRLLAHSASFWSTAIRNEFADLGLTMMKLLAVHTTDQDDEEADWFYMMRDTISQLHECIPADLLPPYSALLGQHFSDLPGHAPHPRAASYRIKAFNRLLPFAPSSTTGAETLVMASSLSELYEHGEYTVLSNDPWKCAEPVEALAIARDTVKIGSKDTKPTQKGALWGPLSLPPLTNTSAMSLLPFAPQRKAAVPPSPYEDWLSHRDGSQRATGEGDDELTPEDVDWRRLASERQLVMDPTIEGIAEDTRSGNRYVAPRLDLLTDLKQGGSGYDEDHDEERRCLASLVGLPSGPVQTMSAYLESEKQKRQATVRKDNGGRRRDSNGKTAAADTKRRGSGDSGKSSSGPSGRKRSASGAASASNAAKKGKKSKGGETVDS
ncbi:unnamed protein product [Sympodiomycopsis kandeliae]